MNILESEMIVMCDVDDTLLMWRDHTQPGEGKMEIVDPTDGSTAFLYPHEKHVDLIRKWHGRGFKIIVWSAGGFTWATAAVKALGLEPYVEMVMTKPCKFMDDLRPNEILGTPVYLPFKEPNETNG